MWCGRKETLFYRENQQSLCFSFNEFEFERIGLNNDSYKTAFDQMIYETVPQYSDTIRFRKLHSFMST